MPTRSVIVYGASGTPLWGGVPTAPQKVSSVAKDASAIVFWYAPASSGLSGITHYVITPYIGSTAQAATTVPIASVTSMSDSYGGTALKATVTGLTNGTAYTFTVKAKNSYGDSLESTSSGANTPFAGLVFGDDFNGPAGAAPNPEWWVYDRCGYLAQNEVQWYKPDHCVLDGSGNLKITAEQLSTSGPRYPTDPLYPGTVTQPWRSGACQSNTMLFTPAPGKSMKFESKFQLNPNAGSGYWPGFFWLEGQDYIDQWKTDPRQEGWNDAGRAEIDIAEWNMTGNVNSYGNVSWAGTNQQTMVTGPGTLATQMHTYDCVWTPGVNVVFHRDGATTATHTVQVPSASAQFFLMLYMQMVSGAPTTSEYILTDYVRVYEI